MTVKIRAQFANLYGRRAPVHATAIGVVLATMLFGALFVGTGLWGEFGLFGGYMIDTDDYTRAHRVLALMQGGSWFEPTYRMIGIGDDGLSMHWTRPNDLLVLALSWPLSATGMNANDAIIAAGTITPALVMIALIATSAWTARGLAAGVWSIPTLRRDILIDHAGAVGALGVVAVPQVMSYGMPSRIDHHGLIILCLSALVGILVRLASWDGTRSRSLAIAGGLIAGFSLWVSVESLLTLICFFCALGALWLFSDAQSGSHRARTASIAAMVAFGSTAVAAVIERGPFLQETFDELDRISMFYILFVAAAGIGFILIWQYERTIAPRLCKLFSWRLTGRVLVASLGASIAGMLVYFLQPQIFHGWIATAIDPLYVAIRSGFINESQPLMSVEVAENIGWTPVVIDAIRWLAPSILGGTAIIALASSRYRSITLVVPVTVAGVFLGWHGMPSIASSISLGIILVPALAAAMVIFFSKVARQIPTGVFAGLAMMILALGALLLPKAPTRADIRQEAQTQLARSVSDVRSCDARAAGMAISEQGEPGLLSDGRVPAVAAFPDFGPSILFHTGYRVLSIPSHRIQPGFDLVYRAMNDAKSARSSLVEAGVRYVVVCNQRPVLRFYGMAEGKDTFGQQLMDGRAPDWLEAVPLVGEHQEGLKVYRVIDEG